MNISGIQSKLEKNANLVALGVGVYGRTMEGDVNLETIIKDSLFELVRTFHSFEQIKWKFWSAPHVPQAIIKIGAGLVLASEVGLLNKKALGWKILKGGLLAAAVTPGSGANSIQNNFQNAPIIGSYNY